MAIFIPKRKEKVNFIGLWKNIFNRKKPPKKDRSVMMEFGPFDGISRVPFGGDVFGEYIINPSTKKFEAFLSEELSAMIADYPDCIDGQNGNVFDNIIDKWLEIATKNIEEQKSMRGIALRTIVNSRKANLKQANDYKEYEEEELKIIEAYIDEVKQKIKNR